ncbi:MAG: Flp pilus assembly protein CpaB, partial [Pseudomonadales bacterium]
KTFTLLFIAVGLGVAGAFLAMLYLNARESSLRDLLRPKSQPISVVVAAKDLLKGDVLDTSTLSVRQIPSDYVDTNVVRPEQFESIEGKVLQQNLAGGKALLRSFIGDEFPLDFSDTIAQKRRAMTIQVDEINTFTGLLRPGNRIDLFVNTTLEGAESKSIVPVLENVEVLTTGRDSAQDYAEKVRFLRGGIDAGINQSFTTVTLNVTPREGALLASAKDKGELVAMLRNRHDNSGSGFAGISQADVVGNAQQLAAKEQLRRQTAALANSVVMGEDGVLRTKDGVALANQNIVIGADGKLRTKSGIDLSGRGLTLNEKGELVDKDGNVIDPDSLIIAADGTVMTKDGKVLDGEKVQSFAGVKRLPDGTVVLADGTVIEGAKLDADGNIVLADGTVMAVDDLVINADGSISDKQGNKVAGLNIAKPAGKLAVNSKGEVVMADGTVLKGATLNEHGQVILADGTVVDADDLIVRADGSVAMRNGEVLAGVSAVAARGTEGALGDLLGLGSARIVDYIAGGNSKDGVATVQKLTVDLEQDVTE